MSGRENSGTYRKIFWQILRRRERDFSLPGDSPGLGGYGEPISTGERGCRIQLFAFDGRPGIEIAPQLMAQAAETGC